MSRLESVDFPLQLITRKIEEIKDFLKISLSIANAHTVDFYTRNVWDQFMAVPPQSVLSIISTNCGQEMAPESLETQRCEETAETDRTNFGFCCDSKRLVDVAALLDAAKRHALPGLGVCVPLSKLLQGLREHDGVQSTEDEVLEPEEFMNSKKSHEVQIMSELVSTLAKYCQVQQVIDVGSGKGYLCSFLSLRYGLKVYGIDSSSTNTHSAQERNRKLKKYSKAYQRHGKTRLPAGSREGEQKMEGVEEQTTGESEHSEQKEHRREESGHFQQSGEEEGEEMRMKRESCFSGFGPDQDTQLPAALSEPVAVTPIAMVNPDQLSPVGPNPENPFLGALSPELVELPAPRVPPSALSKDERERRKRENLERKARVAGASANDSSLYSPLTSYVTAETELHEIISELEDAVVVGLHTCGDLAPSTLRMFSAKDELRATCSVGCCYHLLSEEFDPSRPDCPNGQWGFPMSQHLRDQGWFCGRNARMSACLALERVTVGGGLPTESLFYRAVLHVILRDHYGAIKSEKRVGNVYSKSTSFVDYVRRALRRLGLDDSKISDDTIEDYHMEYRPRIQEMEAFNMLKVSLAPCIEGLILLDRLCYLKQQDNTSFSALVQLFDPLMSPRCYGIVSLKKPSA